MRVWVVEYNIGDGEWKVDEPYSSKRIAEAKCADEIDSPFKAKGWDFRVREYGPLPCAPIPHP